MAYKDPIDDKLELVTRLDEQLRDAAAANWAELSRIMLDPEVRCAHP